MSDIYYKVGVLLDDDFFLSTSTATSGVTGQTANFALYLSKDGVGNQATTGITLTEVSSTTNPGLYHLACSPTTSFVAATGDYSLLIQWTTDRNYSWTQTYRVNSNGLPNGTSGNASFTATANDGRVTDGTNPLTGATVLVRTPGGVDYVTLETDASGLWGPVYFPSDGTWTFYVQLAGYQVTSGTITVSGSTATGPAEDMVLDAIGSASGLLFSTLKTYARLQARGNVGTAANTMIASAINDGLGMVARAFKWSWLQSDGDLIFNEPYSTGTLTLTNNDATVTLSGGTFPTWAANGGKLLINGIYYRIATRTSGTEVEMTTEWAEATTTSSYVMYRDEYSLPTDCMIFGKVFPGTGWGWKPDPVSFSSLREYQARNNFNSPLPGLFAIQNGKIIVWPAPSTTRNWPCIYYRLPATLVNDTDEADWDPLQIEVLQRAIDYQLAVRFGPIMHGDADTCLKHYEKALNLAVNNDRENAPRAGTGRAPNRVTIADLRLPGD